MGERDIATYEAHKFGAKLDAVILVGTKKVSHFMKQEQLSGV